MKTRDKVLGAGIGLAAAAAAGTYFYGKHGAEHREALKGWTLRMRGEVMNKLDRLKEVNQARYDEIVDETVQRYGRMKRVGAAEMKHIAAELKNAWVHIAEQTKGARS
jgi:hypothetical protein